MKEFGFVKTEKLSLKKDFENIFEKGLFSKFGLFTIGYLKNNLDINRFSVIVKKLYFKKAVERNKIKRLYREVIRLTKPYYLKKGFDIVFVVKPKKNNLIFFDVKKSVIQALKKNGFLDENFK